MKVTSQVAPPSPPPKEIVIVLTQDEANCLRAILGNISGRTDTNKVSKFSHDLYTHLVHLGTIMLDCPFEIDGKWGEMPNS